jgi:hypothetical protein
MGALRGEPNPRPMWERNVDSVQVAAAAPENASYPMAARPELCAGKPCS